MKFQFFLILILTVFIQKMNAQAFKPDWDTFTSEKFTLDFPTNVTTFCGVDTVGELHVQLKSDPSKFIIFFVFVGGKFTHELDTESYLSCVRLADPEVGTYLYERYHYFLSPWQNCETASDIRFKGIHDEIMNFIMK